MKAIVRLYEGSIMELEDGLCERRHHAFGEGGGELGFSEVNIFILKALELEEEGTVGSRENEKDLFSTFISLIQASNEDYNKKNTNIILQLQNTIL